MAKQALINREIRRAKVVLKYAGKRKELFEIINNSTITVEERFAARLKLQSIPRNASPSRQRRRCTLTGRPRGVFRKFGLCRNKLRDVAMSGEVPGIVKASW